MEKYLGLPASPIFFLCPLFPQSHVPSLCYPAQRPRPPFLLKLPKSSKMYCLDNFASVPISKDGLRGTRPPCRRPPFPCLLCFPALGHRAGEGSRAKPYSINLTLVGRKDPAGATTITLPHHAAPFPAKPYWEPGPCALKRTLQTRWGLGQLRKSCCPHSSSASPLPPRASALPPSGVPKSSFSR